MVVVVEVVVVADLGLVSFFGGGDSFSRSPGWPQIHYLAKAGFDFLILLPLLFKVTIIDVCHHTQQIQFPYLCSVFLNKSDLELMAILLPQPLKH